MGFHHLLVEKKLAKNFVGKPLVIWKNVAFENFLTETFRQKNRGRSEYQCKN